MSGHAYHGSRHRRGLSEMTVMAIAVAIGTAVLLLSGVLARCSLADEAPAVFVTPPATAPARPAAGLVEHPGEPLPTVVGQ